MTRIQVNYSWDGNLLVFATELFQIIQDWLTQNTLSAPISSYIKYHPDKCQLLNSVPETLSVSKVHLTSVSLHHFLSWPQACFDPALVLAHRGAFKVTTAQFSRIEPLCMSWHTCLSALIRSRMLTGQQPLNQVGSQEGDSVRCERTTSASPVWMLLLIFKNNWLDTQEVQKKTLLNWWQGCYVSLRKRPKKDWELPHFESYWGLWYC